MKLKSLIAEKIQVGEEITNDTYFPNIFYRMDWMAGNQVVHFQYFQVSHTMKLSKIELKDYWVKKVDVGIDIGQYGPPSKIFKSDAFEYKAHYNGLKGKIQDLQTELKYFKIKI